MAGQLLRASTSLLAFLCCASVQWCLASLLVLVEHGPGTVQELVWLFVCSAVRQPRVHPLPSLHSLLLRMFQDDQVAGLPYQLLLLRHDEDKSGVKVGHSEDREHRLGTVGLFLNKENVHPKGQTSLV